MTKKNNLIASILAIIIIFVILFSAFFIFESADHDCSGDDCQICQAITMCETLLKTIYLFSIVAFIATFMGIFMLFLPFITKNMAANISLITLKVKLSN